MVLIIWVQTGFILPESMWCLEYGFRLVLSCQILCGAYNIGSDWFLSCQRVCGAYYDGYDRFYLARGYVVYLMLFLTDFILQESMWCL